MATSGPLTGTRWSLRLPRGKIYSWQVAARRGGGTFRAPTRPAPDAKFKILSQHKYDEIHALRRRIPTAHLLLGLVYADAGMLDEALREFEALVRANPKLDLPRRLLLKIKNEMRRS